jgi:hypothetical protein
MLHLIVSPSGPKGMLARVCSEANADRSERNNSLANCLERCRACLRGLTRNPHIPADRCKCCVSIAAFVSCVLLIVLALARFSFESFSVDVHRLRFLPRVALLRLIHPHPTGPEGSAIVWCACVCLSLRVPGRWCIVVVRPTTVTSRANSIRFDSIRFIAEWVRR